MTDFLNLSKYDKIRLACSMAPYHKDGLPSIEERVRGFYRDLECPVVGHILNPTGSCVYCDGHFEPHEVPAYRDRVIIATPCGPMTI